MQSEETALPDERLETAAEIEAARILKRAEAYRLARAGIIPCYRVGIKRTGVRFRRSEILQALRRPATAEEVPDVKKPHNRGMQ